MTICPVDEHSPQSRFDSGFHIIMQAVSDN